MSQAGIGTFRAPRATNHHLTGTDASGEHPRSGGTVIRRIFIPLIATLGLLVALAGPAGAHVTVSSDNATQGGYATVTFRVPNEESDAATVGIKVQLPVDHPIANVSVQPKPGWTYKVTTSKLEKPITVHGSQVTEAVSEIEWTGGKIEPGEFDQFLIQAGPLPTDTDSLTFKTIQTYRDASGKTSEAAWIQEPTAADSDPDHPAPVLALLPAKGAGASATTIAGGTSDTGAGSASGPSVTATAKAPDSAKGLATTALVVAIVGLLAGLVALGPAAGRRRTSDDGGAPR